MNNKLNFQKIVLVALVAALVAAALPLTGASAAGSSDPTQPPAGQGLSNERLEAIWQKMVNRYDRVGKMFDNDARLAEGAEKMIERLKQEGKPTAELEAALKAYEDALKKAKPVFESCKGIINSHKGFDSSGKVTDAGQAKETIRDLGAKFTEIRNTMGGTGKALAELMKSLRDQYKPTPTPAGGS